MFARHNKARNCRRIRGTGGVWPVSASSSHNKMKISRGRGLKGCAFPVGDFMRSHKCECVNIVLPGVPVHSE
jgi:hypothetical protein